jgi:hypothetical protein
MLRIPVQKYRDSVCRARAEQLLRSYALKFALVSYLASSKSFDRCITYSQSGNALLQLFSAASSMGSNANNDEKASHLAWMLDRCGPEHTDCLYGSSSNS